MPNPQYIQRAKKVKMYYDPRGQVVRTVNPDTTEQWVVFGKPGNVSTLTTDALGLPKPNSTSNGGPTPWESYSYDANDLGGRTHPVESAGSSNHWNTPSSSLLDPLGRTIKTVDRNGAAEVDEVVMQYEFDIRGNLKKVTDALGRTAFTHVYDLKPKSGDEDQGANILKTEHIDSGTKTALFDAAYRPTELRDAKGALILHGYDELNRPTRIWARDVAAEDVTLRQKLIYGDDTTDGPSTPTDTNHLGKLYQHYDEAGLVTLEAYDFKGNVLQKKREVIADSEIKAVFDGPPTDWEVPVFRVNWDSSPTLEGEYITDMEYDALNRTKKMVYPEDEDTERKELIPTYNNAGALEKVTMDGDTYVEHIAYNAKGQRLLIAFGNQGKTMTRYVYDSQTFRLSRMKSEKYVKTGWTFVPQSGTTKNDVAYRYDLAGNIIQMIDKTPAAAKGPNDLTRNFSYDPLYRLLSASGRECDNPTPSPPWDDTPRCTDPTATRTYTRNYVYDLMGNVQQLRHVATGGNFNRDFNYTSASNNHLNSIDTSSTNYAFTYDVNGNMVQELTNRHFEWDHSDQLRAFYDQTGTSEPTVYEHYLYDASGNRLKKITRNNTGSHPFEVTIYIDGIYEKSYKWDGTSGYTEEKNELHIMDDKSRIAMIWIGHDDGTPPVKYILGNHLGSSNTILEDDASVYNREEYFPFGETSFGSFGKKRYRYVGKEKDEYSGLYYYGARYYAAWTCRFVSVDPLFMDFPYYNPFNYAGNKPINKFDIDGLQENGKQVQGGAEDIPPSTGNQPPDSLKTDNLTGGDAEVETKTDSVKTDLNQEKEGDKKEEELEKKDVKDLSTSQKGIDFIKDYEKLEKKLYDDDTGNATIGYGHLVHKGKVGTETESEKKYKDGITETEAEKLLKSDIKTKAEKFVKDNVTVKLTQNQFDALVAFTFNVGGGSFKGSTLLKKVNANETDKGVIKKWFKAWNKGTVNGKKVELKGLTKRRGQEADMFNNNKYDSTH